MIFRSFWTAGALGLVACSTGSATDSSPQVASSDRADASAASVATEQPDAATSAPMARDSADASAPADAHAAPSPVGPTPPASWVSVTGNLAGKTSECGNVSAVFSNPSADELVVGVALDGLWSSSDGAATWKTIGAGGDPIKNRLSSIVWDPAHPATFWESGIYGWETATGGAFSTVDDGVTFTGYPALSTLNQTSDSIAVDLGDPARRTLLAGSHEQQQTLFASTDGGGSWKNIGASLPAGLGFCTATLIVDASTWLVGCAASWSGQSGAIVRTTTGGASFTRVMASGVLGQPLVASDGEMYWSGEGGGMLTSIDQGKTWTRIAPANVAGSLPPIELPDGRIASTSGTSVVVSADHGATWKTVGSPMPYTPNGFTYSPFRNAFFISYFTCTAPNDVPADGIERFGWNYRDDGP